MSTTETTTPTAAQTNQKKRLHNALNELLITAVSSHGQTTGYVAESRSDRTKNFSVLLTPNGDGKIVLSRRHLYDLASIETVTADNQVFSAAKLRKFLATTLGVVISRNRWQVFRVAAACVLTQSLEVFTFIDNGHSTTPSEQVTTYRTLSNLVADAFDYFGVNGFHDEAEQLEWLRGYTAKGCWHEIYINHRNNDGDVLVPRSSGHRGLTQRDLTALIDVTLTWLTYRQQGHSIVIADELAIALLKLRQTKRLPESVTVQHDAPRPVDALETDGDLSVYFDDLLAVLGAIYDGELPNKRWFQRLLSNGAKPHTRWCNRTFDGSDLNTIVTAIETSQKLRNRLTIRPTEVSAAVERDAEQRKAAAILLKIRASTEATARIQAEKALEADTTRLSDAELRKAEEKKAAVKQAALERTEAYRQQKLLKQAEADGRLIESENQRRQREKDAAAEKANANRFKATPVSNKKRSVSNGANFDPSRFSKALNLDNRSRAREAW